MECKALWYDNVYYIVYDVVYDVVKANLSQESKFVIRIEKIPMQWV